MFTWIYSSTSQLYISCMFACETKFEHWKHARIKLKMTNDMEISTIFCDFILTVCLIDTIRLAIPIYFEEFYKK